MVGDSAATDSLSCFYDAFMDLWKFTLSTTLYLSYTLDVIIVFHSSFVSLRLGYCFSSFFVFTGLVLLDD
jgi:hypothetical protein